eukprot:1031812-Prymnesium_polylepis.1
MSRDIAEPRRPGRTCRRTCSHGDDASPACADRSSAVGGLAPRCVAMYVSMASKASSSSAGWRWLGGVLGVSAPAHVGAQREQRGGMRPKLSSAGIFARSTLS